MDNGHTDTLRAMFERLYSKALVQNGHDWAKEASPLDREKHKELYDILEGVSKTKHIALPDLYHAPLAAHGINEQHLVKHEFDHTKQMPHVISKPGGMVMSDALLQHFTPQEASMYVFHEMGHLNRPVSHIALKLAATGFLSSWLDGVRECQADRDALSVYNHPDVLLSMLKKMKTWAVAQLGSTDWYPGIDERIAQAETLVSGKSAAISVHEVAPPLATPNVKGTQEAKGEVPGTPHDLQRG